MRTTCKRMPLFRKRVYPDPDWFDAIEGAVALFEDAVAQMTRDYHKAVKGLPMTERIVELEMTF